VLTLSIAVKCFPGGQSKGGMYGRSGMGDMFWYNSVPVNGAAQQAFNRTKNGQKFWSSQKDWAKLPPCQKDTAVINKERIECNEQIHNNRKY